MRVPREAVERLLLRGLSRGHRIFRVNRPFSHHSSACRCLEDAILCFVADCSNGCWEVIVLGEERLCPFWRPFPETPPFPLACSHYVVWSA